MFEKIEIIYRSVRQFAFNEYTNAYSYWRYCRNATYSKLLPEIDSLLLIFSKAASPDPTWLVDIRGSSRRFLGLCGCGWQHEEHSTRTQCPCRSSGLHAAAVGALVSKVHASDCQSAFEYVVRLASFRLLPVRDDINGRAIESPLDVDRWLRIARCGGQNRQREFASHRLRLVRGHSEKRGQLQCHRRFTCFREWRAIRLFLRAKDCSVCSLYSFIFLFILDNKS